MGRLQDRVIIVTGGAHGIGRAYCQGLAREGARVVVADLDDGGGDELARARSKEGHDALAIRTDVAEPADTEQMARRSSTASAASTA